MLEQHSTSNTDAWDDLPSLPDPAEFPRLAGAEDMVNGLLFAEDMDDLWRDHIGALMEQGRVVRAGAGGVKMTADWRPFMRFLRVVRAEFGTALPVGFMLFEAAAGDPTCPRSVLRELYAWASEDFARHRMAWTTGMSRGEVEHHTPDTILDRFIGAGAWYSLLDDWDIRETEPATAWAWCPRRARELLLAIGDRIARAASVIETTLRTRANLSALLERYARNITSGLAPPGLEATYSVAPVRAGPLGA